MIKLILTILVLTGCSANNLPLVKPSVVGGDKDEHGCIASAGYQWCSETHKCYRPWEAKCEVDTL
jgi:hypothetical protein